MSGVYTKSGVCDEGRICIEWLNEWSAQDEGDLAAALGVAPAAAAAAGPVDAGNRCEPSDRCDRFPCVCAALCVCAPAPRSPPARPPPPRNSRHPLPRSCGGRSPCLGSSSVNMSVARWLCSCGGGRGGARETAAGGGGRGGGSRGGRAAPPLRSGAAVGAHGAGLLLWWRRGESRVVSVLVAERDRGIEDLVFVVVAGRWMKELVLFLVLDPRREPTSLLFREQDNNRTLFSLFKKQSSSRACAARRLP